MEERSRTFDERRHKKPRRSVRPRRGPFVLKGALIQRRPPVLLALALQQPGQRRHP